ncbi:putative RNA-directed DNA polymerase from transposon BS [Trichonephila clavipes]|nr:putative RNA-directed DNA polymerase from transposon BS [Trichonephila clavipes]
MNGSTEARSEDKIMDAVNDTDSTPDHQAHCMLIREHEEEIDCTEARLSYLNNIITIEHKDASDTNTSTVVSLEKEKQDIVAALHSLQDKPHPDLVIIQEAHLRPGLNFNIPNYTTYRNDRQNTNPFREGGGTAVLAKTSLIHHNIPTPPLGVVEGTTVALTPPNGNVITVSSFYISPSYPNTNLIKDIEALFALRHISILYGDFNAHHISLGGEFNSQKEELFLTI